MFPSEYADYVPELLDFDRRAYEGKVKKLSSGGIFELPNDKDKMDLKYEFLSKSAGKLSEIRSKHLSDSDRMLLAMYGKEGSAINSFLREGIITGQEIEDANLGESEFKNKLKRYKANKISPAQYREMNLVTPFTNLEEYRGDDQESRNRKDLIRDFTGLLNDVIRKHTDSYLKEEFPLLYRVTRVKKNVFRSKADFKNNVGPQERQSTISPGDIIFDNNSFMSTSMFDDVAIYRYSREYGGATEKSDTKRDEGDVEEIIYIIKNTSDLPVMNISRQKFPREYKDQSKVNPRVEQERLNVERANKADLSVRRSYQERQFKKSSLDEVFDARFRRDVAQNRYLTDEELLANDPIPSRNLTKVRDAKSSGEMLIATGVFFKVVGVQHDRMVPGRGRKAVIIEPLRIGEQERLKKGEGQVVIKHPYDGERTGFAPPKRVVFDPPNNQLGERRDSVGAVGGIGASSEMEGLFSRSRASSSEMGTAGGLENPLSRSRASSLERERAERSWWKKLCCFK